MTTALITHETGLTHEPGPQHPERPARLKAVADALAGAEFAALLRLLAPEAPDSALHRVHPAAYVEAVREASPAQGFTRLDADTAMSPGTLSAALYAAGGAMLGVDQVLKGAAQNAFVAMRPPGHHAERATAMGFCFFNSVAVAARHAQKAYGVERVAIVDFDVHHGNGTQDIFWADPTVLYASTHEMPLYPGSGHSSERGDFDNIVNAPLKAGDDGEAYRIVFSDIIMPRLRAFKPDLVLISAGFDAHTRDPLANINLEAEDFTWVTKALMEIADATAGGRIVSVLEGGYDLQGLAESSAAHVRALMRG